MQEAIQTVGVSSGTLKDPPTMRVQVPVQPMRQPVSYQVELDIAL